MKVISRQEQTLDDANSMEHSQPEQANINLDSKNAPLFVHCVSQWSVSRAQ
jgi:hypothetical protein